MAAKKTNKLAMSRRTRDGFIIISILLVAGVLLLDRQAGKKLRDAILNPDTRQSDIDKYHQKTFKIINTSNLFQCNAGWLI